MRVVWMVEDSGGAKALFAKEADAESVAKTMRLKGSKAAHAPIVMWDSPDEYYGGAVRGERKT